MGADRGFVAARHCAKLFTSFSPRISRNGRQIIRLNHTLQPTTTSNVRKGFAYGGFLGALVGISGLTLLQSRPEPKDSVLPTRNTEPGSSKYATRQTMIKAAEEIQSVLGEDSVSFDSEDLENHGYSEWSTSNTTQRPVAVVSPCSTEEVSSVAKICFKYHVPMIPYGAGSSVEGNFSAPFSGICIDLSRMDKIIAIREADMDATVQPGVNWVNLNEILEKRGSGLFLPLDPSPTALIGGMISTNCSGTNAVRYGTMKDWVVNLTVVLADGKIIKTKRRPRKTSAGYNLNSLFAGSEGTLGIITEATVKLATTPKHFSVATAVFPTVGLAAEAASTMVRAGLPLAALEMMDEVQMRIINQNGGAGGRMWEEAPTLFIKFSGTTDSVKDNIVQAQVAVKNHKGTKFEIARSEQDMKSLWAARKEALWAVLAIRPPGTQLWSTDVAVPMSNLAEIIEISKQRVDKLGLTSTVLGHVGDGNFHQAVIYNPDVAEQKEAVKACVDNMMITALEMEGTVSGEHGIGLGKKNSLAKELSPETMDVMRAVKRSLDPRWLLNPGKIFDEDSMTAEGYFVHEGSGLPPK